MLASTPAGPQWTYHQWVCLSGARAAPPSPCRVSLVDTVGTLFTAIPIVIASVYSVSLTVGGYGSTGRIVLHNLQCYGCNNIAF